MALMAFFIVVGSSYADNTPEYTMECEGITRVYKLHIPEGLPEKRAVGCRAARLRWL